jgi:selenocysteine lyase/cysteine desulfurase
MYRNLQEAGCEVTILAAKGGTIPLSDMEAALTAGARFVAISATSSRNGHEYDLAALSELAHRHGALVYADIIQTAGASPIDLKLAGVDFAGCGAYKWLMGDMGLGFLYVREGHHACLAPPVGGGEQFDNASGRPRRRTGAAGLFEVGTVAASVLEALLVSLPALIEIGPAQVAEARQPVLRKIRHAGTALGLRATTPQQSRSPILAFEGEAITPALLQGLAAEHISVTGRAGWLRISVSTFNDEADIDHLAATIERCLQGSS